MELRPLLLAAAAACVVAACGPTTECPPGTTAEMGGVCVLADAGPMCAGALPFEVEGVCVECLFDTQCSNGVCTDENTCAECTESSDCPSDRPVCDDAFACVECLTSANCQDSAAPICADSTCVACDGDSTCVDSALPYCLEDRSACVECTSDEQCTDGVCDPGTNACVQCVENTDCTEPGATFCSANTCVECQTDEQCESSEAPFCSAAGACVTCANDSHCTEAGAEWCDLDANTCVECLTNDHCGTAGASECGADGACTTCTAETSCGHLVDTPHCALEGALAGTGCVECRPTESDCSGNSCSPVTATCTMTLESSISLCEPCLSSAECTTGVCVRIAGSGATGGVCVPERTTPSAACPPMYQMTGSGLDTAGIAVDYCRPRISCANVRELMDLLDQTTPTINCTTNPNCVPGNRCGNVSGYANRVCTLTCDSALDCPAELGGGSCGPDPTTGGANYCNGG